MSDRNTLTSARRGQLLSPSADPACVVGRKPAADEQADATFDYVRGANQTGIPAIRPRTYLIDSESAGARSLEERRLSLAHAHAERREPVAAAAAPQLVQERHDEAGAAHPSG